MLIAPRHVWAGGRLLSGIAIEVEGGRVRQARPLGDDLPDWRPHLAMPGASDLQVNGGGGVLVNGEPTPDGLRAIRDAHARLGTAEIMPTVITDAPEVLEAAADAILAVRDEPGFLGLHIEGPHIAPERRGTHDAAHVRPLDRRTVDLVARLRSAGVRVMVTLAPESADPALLAEIVGTGAVVSAGHSAATAEETRAALAAGVSCFTHLFNAMPPMTSRAPGILGAAILSDAACGIIADGIHVGWDMLRLALAARPKGAVTFLVSDAMPTVGGPDRFTLYGRTIRLAEGRLVNAEGALAGAHVDMLTSLARLHRHADVPLERCVGMATDLPRRVLGLPPVRIGAGTAVSALAFLGDDLALAPIPA